MSGLNKSLKFGLGTTVMHNQEKYLIWHIVHSIEMFDQKPNKEVIRYYLKRPYKETIVYSDENLPDSISFISASDSDVSDSLRKEIRDSFELE